MSKPILIILIALAAVTAPALDPGLVAALIRRTRAELQVTATPIPAPTDTPLPTIAPVEQSIAAPTATFDLRIPTGWPECLTPPPWPDPIINDRCDNYWPRTLEPPPTAIPPATVTPPPYP